MKDSKDRCYRFDEVEVDVQNLRVTVGSEIRPLEPKSFRLLLFLIENPGRVLPKDEIMAVVWPDVAVSDNSLARAITQIRKALDDDPKAPRYIETVPSVGYRFIGEIKAEEPILPVSPAPATSGSVAPSRHGWGPIAMASVALALLVTGTAWWMRRPAAVLKNPTFVQLTDQPGQELYPSLAPDGKSVVYAGRASGNWDIYSQRVGGKNPVNLTKDSPADDTEPAFSPDGERIAFRSDRDGGGIFVMEASGENVKRITKFGHDPAWSPDGTKIVYGSTVADPGPRLSSQSQLFIANIATGETRPITPPTGNAEQPNWSPHGYRVAYWAQLQGRLDVWTIPAGGGEAVRITNDAAVDWNPVWSPDGNYLYFASDRGGSMNLWRAPMDEKTGKVLGEIEPVTVPSPYAANLSFSRAGRQMAYMQRTQTANIYRAGFDPVSEKATSLPMPITRGTRNSGSVDPSPDGEWVVFVDSKDDLCLIRNDGTGQRNLTNDAYIDRRPAWSPDGSRVAFHSNRGGRFDIWTVRPDASDLQQLTHIPEGSLTHAVWSPDGKRLIYSVQNGTTFVIDVDKPWSSQTPQALPPLKVPDTWFEASSWSPDGHKVAGFQLRGDGKFTGIVIYSFDTGEYTQITDFGFDSPWLKDSRRLLFTRGHPRDTEIYLIDSQTQKKHSVLDVAPNEVGKVTISADNAWIYFDMEVTEADIWLANL